MKKLILLFAIPFYLFACKSSHELKKYKQISSDSAVKLSYHYAHLPTFDINTNIIRMITLPTKELAKLDRFKQDIRLTVGAYLADNALGKKDEVTLIMQLWRKGAYTFYDLKSIFQPDDSKGGNYIMYKIICPPPINCNPLTPPTD